MHQYSVVLLLIAIPAATSEGACKSPDNTNTCSKIFNELSSVLVNDKGNLYRMQQAFFYAPNADPALIKVKYNISYGDNITKDRIQYCGNVDNTSAIVINETEIIRGWTSRGVYYVINPLTLSRMQMVLPFAILRLVNKKWRSKYGSPEVDTFLWDGTYELPTLLVNLHITSLPCIPSEEVFNYTLDELNAHLKIYTEYQDLVQFGSTAIQYHNHVDDIAYTLSEDQLLHPQEDQLLQWHSIDQTDASYYTFSLILSYCMFGYFLIILLIWRLYNMKASKNMKLLRSISSTILDHVDFVISAVFIGYLFIVSEFIATAVYFRSQGLYYITFHMYLWIPSLLCLLNILFKVVKICCYKKCNHDCPKFLIAIFERGILLFLLHIYCYGLPTFLLLLVYPTKVITVVAYLTTLIFGTSIVSSITLRLLIVRIKKYRTSTVIDHRSTSIIVIFGAILFIIYILCISFMFGTMIQFLYLLVLGEASAISTGPYTVLSLIPTAAISAASWLVKNKVFSSINEKEDEEEPNQENHESETNDDEARTLTLVVNEGTPLNGNHQEVRSYGTADNDN